MFLKVPVIIIRYLVKIMFYGKNISIYINFGGGAREPTWPTLHFSFIIQKNVKSTRA